VTQDTGIRQGPTLPYSLVAGITPVEGGWLVSSAKLRSTVFSFEDPVVISSLDEVLNMRPSFAAVALNAPVGRGGAEVTAERSCDREVRHVLAGRGIPREEAVTDEADVRGETVHLDDVPDGRRSLLIERYEEVAAEMAPFRQRSIYEALPDLSIFQINDDHALQTRRNEDDGVAERRALLLEHVTGVDRVLDAEVEGVSELDLIDAASCLMTARRVFGKAASRLPVRPEWDDEGLRMEIVR